MSLIPWKLHYPYQNDEILNLDWVLKEIETFKTTFESWANIIEELQKGLANISDWEDRIEDLEKVTSKLPNIEKTLADLSNLHKADIDTLKSMIADLQKQINDLDVAALKIYIDSKDNQIIADFNKKLFDNYALTYELFNGLKDRLEVLANIIADIDTKAYNPWARRIAKESLQTNLDYAYADLADIVPTAQEYAEIGLTANDYLNYDMTAHDYSINGRFNLKLHFVYSPVYGFKQELNNVLTSIVNFIKGTISADEYSNLELDADDYTALDLTADDYYLYLSAASGLVATGGTGLTSDQYSTLQIL